MHHPSLGQVVAAAASSVIAHSFLDAIPPAAVQRLVRRCGAVNSDGFDLRMWLHSLVMGVGAMYVFIHDQRLVPEPHASYACLPPPSIFSWILPAAEMGYALHDLRDAIRLGSPSFILHGAFVGGFLAAMFCLQVAHHMTIVISVHLSSVFLNLRRVDFGPPLNAAVDVAFAASFFVLRVLFLPVLWVIFLRHGMLSDAQGWGECMLNGRVINFAIGGGVILHGLNAYWAVQIVARVRSRWRDADGLGRSGGAEGHYHRSKRA